MRGNGYVEEWSKLCSFQPAIMVKGDIPKHLQDGNGEFIVP
jgi:hypothetical protein